MPTTTGLATSFITFSRPGASGGGATVTDRDGKIKWAGHNLLTNSESFDSSSWTKTTTTVSANSHAAPNSTTTAETLTASSANGTTLQSYTALAVSYTFGVWLKRKTGTGNIQIAADSGTYTTVTITSDWALYTVTQTPAAGTISAGIRIVTSGDEVYAWGAHLYRSDLGGMQANPAMPANMGSYYPTTPRNLLGYTEDFSNAAWTKTGVLAFGSGSVSNAAVAPNGLQTADLLIENTANSTHEVNATYASITNTPYTFSVYAKAAGRNWCVVTTGVAGAWFNLSSGTVGTTQAGCTATISSVGNGWFLCRATVTETSGSGTRTPRIYIANADNVVTYTGDGTSGIYLWGAQLSDSASLDTYVPQYGAAVTSAAYYAPRLDYDPVTLAARGLLVEEQRTNLLLHSAAFDNAAWTLTAIRAFGSGSIANAATAPDGTSTADLITEDTTTSEHRVLVTSIGSSAATYTLSVSCKAANGSRNALIYLVYGANGYSAFADLSSGTVTGSAIGVGTGSASISSQGDGWYRVSVTFVAGGTMSVSIGMATSANVGNYAGDGTSGIYIWGAQVEAGSFATSYIPTGSATATRTADVASVSTQAFPYSSSASSLVVSYTAYGDGNENILELSNGSTNGLTFSTSVTGNVISAFVDASSASLGAAVLNQLTKLGLAYDGVSNGAVRNGGTVSSVGTTATAATRMMIGSYSGGGFTMSGHIRQITYLPRRISNAELQSRTA